MKRKFNIWRGDSKKGNYKDIKIRMNLFAFSDGKENIFNISKKINSPLNEVIKEYKVLLKAKLLKNKYY